MRLEGKTALITGSGRNIGKAIALTFAREGADVILNTRSNAEELEGAAVECRSYGVKAVPVLADVSDPEQAARLVEEGLAQLGKIDVLVSSVAIRPRKPILEVSNEEWHQVMAVNLHATFYLCKAVLPGMMERHTGSIIAIGGKSSLSSTPINAAVATSKTALWGLIRSLAVGMAPYGIRANMVMPASIETEKRYPEWYPESYYRHKVKGSAEFQHAHPLGKQGTPQDIANACLFLASNESSYITGDSIVCMGGRNLI